MAALSPAPSGMGWAQLRQQARSLESQTEAQLHTYSYFSSAANLPPHPTEEERGAEKRAQELLEKRDAVIAQLTRLLDSEAALTSSATKQNNLALLRDKVAEHRRDLVRLRSGVREARSRANLLGSVREDISAFHSGGAARGRRTPNNNNNGNNKNRQGRGSGEDSKGSSSLLSAQDQEEADYMLDERGRIDGGIAAADGILSQAYAMRDEFVVQRETLQGIQRRITGAASQVPGLNTLIGRISARKRRDGIIMGSFIALCFVTFWFLS